MRSTLSKCIMVALCLSGCNFHRVDENPQLLVEVPADYSDAPIGEQLQDRWWLSFGEKSLNALIAGSLEGNLSLKQAWQRLLQASRSTDIAASAWHPQVNVEGNITNNRLEDRRPAQTVPMIPGLPVMSPSTTKEENTRYSATASLSYEFDLWGRIGSQVKASDWFARATREDAEATALLLTGNIVELWLSIQEQRELLELLDRQVDANRTQLELLELRFSVGQASALDVYQQRQTLAGTETQIPRTESLLETSLNNLSVLLGYVPGDARVEVPRRPLPQLPPFPQLPTPAMLLERRPDLRAAHARVLSADYEIGAALADFMPRLDFLFSFEISTLTLHDLLERQVRNLVGNLLQPVLDGGRRYAELQRRRAVVKERLLAFSETFLSAMLEVENALTQERKQVELLERLAVQEEAASANLREAQQRYINGLNDYLTVIAALQTVQALQRTQISERRQLLIIRSQLYRALGGYWTQELEPEV